ncbi:MAG: AbrB/MazE/SpoVT family DNA-binding domain-containing protein [Terriglobia bacterium]|jgi:AbrB family looped-hinge helix DNA binding protein
MAKAKTVLENAVRMGAKNQITIPHRITKALRLKKGDHMLVRMVGKTVELVPATIIPKDQRWFWTPEWQEKEKEVDEALARGDFKESDSVEELLNDLKS